MRNVFFFIILLFGFTIQANNHNAESVRRILRAKETNATRLDLRYLNLTFLPDDLEFPPSKITSQGTDAILEFLREQGE